MIGKNFLSDSLFHMLFKRLWVVWMLYGVTYLYGVQRDITCQDQSCHQLVGPIGEIHSSPNARWSAFRPFYYESCDAGMSEQSFLYPLYHQKQTATQKQVNALGIFHHRMAQHETGMIDDECMVFPFYFYRNSGYPETSYRGLFPIMGCVKNTLGYRKISWLLFPLSLRLEKPDAVRYSLPWPFVQWLSGPESSGFALWPLAGRFQQHGSYRHEYFLWPLVYNFWDHLDTPQPLHRKGFLPFYSHECSQNTRREFFPWPFCGYFVQKTPFYYERHYFWPFFVQGWGQEHRVNRWAPFYTYSAHHGKEKTWILWPMIKKQRWTQNQICIHRDQLLYVLVWRERQHSLDPSDSFYAEKMHIWPFLSYWDNGQGLKQAQVLSPFEVFFPHNEIVRRLYSPLFALYRYESYAGGCCRQSLLFNLFTHEQTQTELKWSLWPIVAYRRNDQQSYIEFLKGFIGMGKKNGKNTLKLFWISLF